ncbi:hypothetical protein BJ875DRAFT_370634 [Amylocarpus encephaloides]|uniref:Uncharacterized protein n=1 Tax=Amylocarpus encephaloides TaxID=45428 RepID=A0A9P7YP30_9HELO|nr:hypothetical protein BJ875DRAFT_370634 [Amylocarpus encephaloides]
MSSNEGHQSPPPERSSGAQLKDTPADGQGVNPSTNNKEESQSQLEGLTSNPKGPLDDHVKTTTSKTTDPSEGSK